MLDQCPVSRKRLYLVNQHGSKLLQLVVKDEQTRVAAVRHAQLKIIPYGTRRARVYFNWTGSTEKLAVRAKSRQSEGVGIRLAVDQQQVGLDVAFTVACPIAAQVVVAVFGIERLVSGQRYENGPQIAIERRPVLPFGLTLVIAFEGRSASIVRMQVCHQIINVGEPLALPGLKLGNGLARGGIGNLYIEGQTALIGYAQHQQADSVRNGQTHCFERIGGAFLGVGVDAGADIGIGGAHSDFP